jgi:prepilin-type N-terminal cleavage/methylation domain-containing protein
MFYSRFLHRSRECRSGRTGGFSLVELLVVMAILAAMTLIAVPWFVKITQRNALKSAAREVSITLAAARMTAVKENAPVNIILAQVTPPIEIQTLESAPPAPTPTKGPSSLMLPASAVFLAQTPNSTGGTIIFGGDGRLTNFTTTPAIMILEGPTNVAASKRNQITIQTDLTGRIKVVTPVDWK